MTKSGKSFLAMPEALISGVFGTVLCILVAMLPMLMLELRQPILPGGHSSEILILLACIAIEALNIWRIWTALLDQSLPPGPSAAVRYQPSRYLLFRVIAVVWYLFHMAIALCFIGMCKYKAVHGESTGDKVVGFFMGLAMFGAFNIFIALVAKAATNNNETVMRLWGLRFIIDIFLETVVLAIGFLIV